MEDLAGLNFATSSSAPKSAPPKAARFPPAQPTTFASPVPSRSFSPNYYANVAPNGNPKPSTAAPKPSIKADSFASLSSFSGISTGQRSGNASLEAQRLERERERREAAEAEKRKLELHFGAEEFWEKQQSRGGTPQIVTTSETDADLAGFSSDAPVNTASHFPPPTTREKDDPVQDPFDMSSFENGLTAPSPHPRYHTSPGQLETSSDDILGLLAQPVESFQKPATPPQKTVPRKSTPVEVESSDDEDSPRDRAIAAIVEMGFSIGQAARALSQTPSGLDVQLALENLLSRPSSAASSRARNATPDPARRGPAPPPQKDLSHIAGEVGTSLWKGAGSLWKTGREKVNTLIQEYQTPDAVEPGVPKWMREQQRYTGGRVEGGVSGTEEARKLEGGSRARDRIALAKQVEQEAEMGYRSSARRKVPSRTATPQERPPSRTAMPPVNPPEGDLFPPAPPRPSRTTTPQISKPTTPKPQRIIPPVSDAALATSNAARQRGSEAFKLGDYTSALTHYTTALTPLPATHPARTILLSNRAITNLKLGDAKAAVADCDALLAIVGEGRGEGEMVQDGEGEKSLKEIWGRGIVRRASGLEMLEKWDGALEMWRVAVNAGVGGTLALDGKKRCEAALGIAPAPVAAAGIPRSRSTPIPRTSTPRVGTPRSNTPRPKPAVAKGPSASESLAQYNATAAAEEDEKLRLYDAVEAKVTAWQGGKESNLRALLSSLDSILWAETGWKKVNMAELVVPNRVKIVYMKAIAKVHPDKIATVATVEQRMIAAAVFAKLNGAWAVFKEQNGL